MHGSGNHVKDGIIEGLRVKAGVRELCFFFWFLDDKFDYIVFL